MPSLFNRYLSSNFQLLSVESGMRQYDWLLFQMMLLDVVRLHVPS